ncbi:ACR261Cp, related, related [Eimeria acervulina]|uniref:ACR261Cp, related, related n=1 Tax=Eimeria acervulina TaxID=5801 RepID=U6GHZ7_EIMAC|nr:ACR261Cp, related, related [Eimeria acervulina]CDI79177.1 ACR261Cp, related, related [Eimeria acervulina]
MSVLLEDPFYRSAATAGAAAACILSLLPLLGDGYQLLRGRLSSRSRSSSSNSSGSKTGVAAARGVHTSPKTLAFRLTLVVPVYALTSLLAFLYCSPLNSLPAAAPAAAAAAAVPAASGALSSASAAAAGAQELSPRAAVAAAAAAATALQQRSGGWIGLWLRGAREGYEVYALYAFLELLIALLGGEQQAVNQLHLKTMAGTHKETRGSVAMYALILFYMAVQRPLSPWRPLPKFLWLKSIVFLCFWQSLALRWLAGLFLTGTGEEAAAPAAAAAAAAAAARLQDWLICIEMVPCAGDSAAASAAAAAAAAATPGVYAATSGAEERNHEGEHSSSSNLHSSGYSSMSSSRSNSSKLKKPLQQLPDVALYGLKRAEAAVAAAAPFILPAVSPGSALWHCSSSSSSSGKNSSSSSYG